MFIPRYIHDVIREICRPMKRDGLTFVPYFDLTHGGNTFAPGAGYEHSFVNSVSELIAIRQDLDPVKAGLEAPACAALMICTDEYIVHFD
ncbi:hypothetical protein EV182_006580, partial [Spiromyces aspiralis]